MFWLSTPQTRSEVALQKMSSCWFHLFPLPTWLGSEGEQKIWIDFAAPSFNQFFLFCLQFRLHPRREMFQKYISTLKRSLSSPNSMLLLDWYLSNSLDLFSI